MGVPCPVAAHDRAFYEPSGNVGALTVFYAIPLTGTKEDGLPDQLRKQDGFARPGKRYVDVPASSRH